jgi:hypothetical protein
MQINKYEHEHDGGSKKKTIKDHHKIVPFFIFSKKVVKI